MTTARQIFANRVNARKSTGPLTVHAKARISRNALRHGLNIPVLCDPALSKQVEKLARKIAGETSNAVLFHCACAVAEAQVDIDRVRRARHALLLRGLPSEHASVDENKINLIPTFLIYSRTRQLLRLARYERRALSRRKLAVREFDAARAESNEHAPYETSRKV